MVDSADGQTLKAPRRIGVKVGAGGQLGRCLVRQIESAPDLATSFALTRAELDLSDEKGLSDGIARALDEAEGGLPEVVVNAAAYTKVDRCESEQALAYQTNALAPGSGLGSSPSVGSASSRSPRTTSSQERARCPTGGRCHRPANGLRSEQASGRGRRARAPAGRTRRQDQLGLRSRAEFPARDPRPGAEATDGRGGRPARGRGRSARRTDLRRGSRLRAPRNRATGRGAVGRRSPPPAQRRRDDLVRLRP